MDTIYKDFLALWGAGLSTLLGISQLFKYFKDRPKILVDAKFIYKTCGESDEIKGTRINLGDKGWNELVLGIKIVNSGSKAIQISAVVVEDKLGNINQIMPDKLPAVLEPLTSVEVEIQKEWIDKTEVTFFGVIDALGKRHSISKASLRDLLKITNQLPSNKKKYEKRDDPKQIVEAFQVKDKFTIIKKSKS